MRLLFHSLLERVGGGWGFVGNWTAKFKGGGTMLDLDGEGGGGS